MLTTLNADVEKIGLPAEIERLQQKEEAQNILLARAKKLGITVEKLIAMEKYAQTLRLKNPRMNSRRIMQKVAQQFKIKLT